LTLGVRAFALIGAAVASMSIGVSATPPPPVKALSCTLSVARPSAGARVVTLSFTLRNGGDRSIAVLGWNTPFDGWFGEYLDVTRDGARVPYKGPVAKRGAPDTDDYVTVQARGQRTARIDLSLAYAVKEAGRYRVTFRGVLHDVRVDGASRPTGLNPTTLDCGAAEFSVG
jgi:hypothetical protein